MLGLGFSVLFHVVSNPLGTDGDCYEGALVALSGADIEANITLAGLSTSVSEDRYSIGDLALTPLLLYWSSGNFHYSLAESIVCRPRGKI
jgi:hypothetical protein